MNKAIVICRKELRDFSRNRFFVILFSFLAVIMVLSVVIAAAGFRSKIADYNQYVTALQASGSTIQPKPQLFALQLLRGSIEYLELIGALFAIIIGYGMVAKEKYRGTIELLFSRPLSKYALPGGKILALATLWFFAVLGILALTTLSLIIIGNAPLHAVDYLRLFLAGLLSWAYLLFWSCLAMALTARMKQLSSALIMTLVIWLVFVLITPQIGDTMDPDNQVPGGLFNSLQVDKTHERLVTAKFSGYETTRNYIETTSITKHYERAVFAFLGIKEEFNQKPVSYVFGRIYPNMLAVVLGLSGSIILALEFSSKRILLRKES